MNFLGTEDLFKWKKLAMPNNKQTPETFEHYIKHIPGWKFKRSEGQTRQAAGTSGLVKVDVHNSGGPSGQLSGLIAAKDTKIERFGYNDPPPHIEIRPISERVLARSFVLTNEPLGLLDKTEQGERGHKKKKRGKKTKREGDEHKKKKKKRRRQGSSSPTDDSSLTPIISITGI